MRTNLQPPEKRIPHSPTLQVHSIFHTIQGEGPFTGTPAVFVRLAGCNLQCPGCDTDYTSTRTEMTAASITEQVLDMAGTAKLVVITGGEPFRQNLYELIQKLCSRHFTVQVETNGTMEPTEDILWWRTPMAGSRSGACFIVCSPKTGSVHPVVYEKACAFKYVGRAGELEPSDGLPIRALDHSAKPRLARPRLGAKVYLQPMDEQDEKLNQENLAACVQSCLVHGYTLCLQTHKLLGLE